MKPTEKFKEYDTKRVELGKKHAKKDEKGEPIVVDGSFDIENKKVFEKEHNVLQEEYKDDIAEREKQIAEYNSLLDEESTVELHKINLSQVPEEITTKQMYNILPIIEE